MYMRKILYTLAVSLLLMGGPALALANISFDSDTPADPQTSFSFFCFPGEASYIEGHYYIAGNPSPCTYGLPAQQMASSSIFLAIYKGTEGNATLNSFDFGPLPPHSILRTTPNSFSAVPGDDFFSVAVGYDDFSKIIEEDAAFQTGGTPPLPYVVTHWKWGLPLTVTANDLSVQYGSSSLPTFTYNITGFTSGGSQSDVTGSAACTTTATASSAPGTYPITCTEGSMVAPNPYAFDTFVPGTLTITKAPLSITPNNISVTYGSFVLSLSAIISGFVNNETLSTSDVLGEPSCITSASVSSPVGSYGITCSLGTLHSNNYTFATFFPGLFTINKAPLTVTADNKSMYPGTTVPPLTSTISDFVNNDTTTSNDITGGASCSTSATSASPVGTYPITCTQGSLASSNYYFANFVSGTVTVSPPPPTRCLWALNPTDTSLQMTGSGGVIGSNCVTQVNSSNTKAVSLTGSSDIQAVKNCFVGGVSKTGKSSVSPAPLTNCQVALDPFASITKPTVPTTCDFTNYTHSGSAAVTLNPGTYCGGMKFSGSNKITFNPGIYILKNGSFTVSGSEQLTGTGVSFFLTGTNAGLVVSGSGSWHFSATKTGLLKGFVVYLDGSSTGIAASSQFSGSSDFYLEGVTYLPKQTMQFSGSNKTSASSPFTSFVADKFMMSGSGSFTLNGNTAQSTVPVPEGLYYTN